MNNLNRRIERLEKRTGTKPGPRIIYLTPNLEQDEPDETPYLVKLSSNVCAHIFGAPLSYEEIQALKGDFWGR